jgi:hypothetical protein
VTRVRSFFGAGPLTTYRANVAGLTRAGELVIRFAGSISMLRVSARMCEGGCDLDVAHSGRGGGCTRHVHGHGNLPDVSDLTSAQPSGLASTLPHPDGPGLLTRSVPGSGPPLPPPPPAAVVDLLGMLAYGELVAFDRLAAEARLAPDLARRATLSEMAGAEIAEYGRIVAGLVALGADPVRAMTPFVAPLDDYHAKTAPNDWLESLTKAYIGRSIADDLVRELADFLEPANRALIAGVRHDSRYAQYAATEIRAALRRDPDVANRLSMWARRLVGEGMRQAQRVAADRPAITALVIHATKGAPTAVSDLLKRLTLAHIARMGELGLNS